MNRRLSLNIEASRSDWQTNHAEQPASEIPPAMPAESIDELRPHPAACAGGLDNIPEDLLPEDEQVKDELNHAGLDAELPGEDRITH